MSKSKPWDPLEARKKAEKPSKKCIFVTIDPENITTVHALITGPPDTPYEGGAFHFLCVPPVLLVPLPSPRLAVTHGDGGRVRFNPNLYADGKVCLSILGTWSGPGWSSVQTLSSVLVSIQSLMNEKPYHNEPGFEEERTPGDAANYNNIIRHETIRVAMLENVEHIDQLPESLRDPVLDNFDVWASSIETQCEQLVEQLDGRPFQDPFKQNRGKFRFGRLRESIARVRGRREASRSKEDEGGAASGGGAAVAGHESDAESSTSSGSSSSSSTGSDSG